MMRYPRGNKITETTWCTLAYVSLGALVALVMIVGGLRLCLRLIEEKFWKVHPSEQHIATNIRQRMGGAYHADPKQDWHITGAWLQNTTATDGDVQEVLRLERLEFLDVSNTQVTDASLDLIVRHKRLRILRLAGSRISQDKLKTALNQSKSQISIED